MQILNVTTSDILIAITRSRGGAEGEQRGHSGKMSAHARRISGFRGVICDSSVDDVCQLTNKRRFILFTGIPVVAQS